MWLYRCKITTNTCAIFTIQRYLCNDDYTGVKIQQIPVHIHNTKTPVQWWLYRCENTTDTCAMMTIQVWKYNKYLCNIHNTTDTCAMAADASKVSLLAIRLCDFIALSNSFISWHKGVSFGATDSSNRCSVSNTKSLSTDVSLSPTSDTSGSTMDTMELSTIYKYRTDTYS